MATKQEQLAAYAAIRDERVKEILRKSATPSGWGRKDFGISNIEPYIKIVTEMVKQRRLFAASLSGGGRRYFATPELATAFMTAKRKSPAGRPAGPGTKNCAQWKPSDKAIVPKHVKVQRAPTPKGRYHVDGIVVGGFVSEWHTLRGQKAA